MTSAQLASCYDAALLDLDGTIYEGDRAVPHAQETLAEAGLPMLFITNNASRPPQVVADQLQGLGYECSAEDVITSAQAALDMAKDVIPVGSKVYVLGAESFKELAREAGYIIVDSADDEPAAVFQGLNREMTWKQMSEAALAINRGAKYLASNLDTTLPDERGRMVGNGAVAAALTVTTGVEPMSAGKPEAPMFHSAAARVGAQKPLCIGDRLNTDIAGGNAAGYDTLMVVTGISGHHETLTAIPAERPTMIGADMRALLAPIEHAKPQPQAGLIAEVDPQDPSTVILSGGDMNDPRFADATQAAVAGLLTAASVAWAADTSDENAVPITSVRPDSEAARIAIAAWR